MFKANKHKEPTLLAKVEQLETGFEQLSQQFIDALSFLKKTKLKQQRKTLYDLPLFLMIGLPGSGKTSLLAHSGLRFLLAKRSYQKAAQIKSTATFDWWATKDALFLDMAGKYLQTKEESALTRKHWLKFLQLLQRHRAHYIDGVIMTVSLPKLLLGTAKQRRRVLVLLKQALHDIQQGLKSSIPVHLIFTEVDCLPGFYPFFEDLTVEQREQFWGFDFLPQQLGSVDAIIDRFDREFDVLLKRLHQHLLARLHQESDLEKLSAIKDFPLQVESIKQPLLSFIHKIASATHNKQLSCLRGVYFTSAGGQEKQVDPLLPCFDRIFDLSLPVIIAPRKIEGAFFIKNIFTQVIFQDIAAYSQQRKDPSMMLKRRMGIASVFVMSVLIILCAQHWVHQFSQQVVQLGTIEDALTRYELLNAHVDLTNVEQAIPAINELLKITEDLQQVAQPWWSRLRLKSSDNLEQVSQHVYNDVIAGMLNQQLQQVLKKQLSHSEAVDPALLYGALATYIMLVDPQYFNQSAMTEWLYYYWKYVLVVEPPVLTQLMQHTNNYLSQSHKPMKFDHQLLAQAREMLNAIPVQQLVVGIVEYTHQNQQRYLWLPSIDKQPIFSSDTPYFVLSDMYTRSQFSQIYEKSILEAAKQLRFGNWIMGTRVISDDFDKVITQAREYYTQKYIENWQAILNSLTLQPVTDGVRLVQILDALVREQSEINQLLATIHYNTNVEYLKLQTPISLAFKSFNRFFDNYQQGGFLTVGAHLNRLLDYVSDINGARDQEAAAFVAVKQRMLLGDVSDVFDDLHQQASIAPAPLKQWIFSLTNDAWKILLMQTRHYVEQRWQRHVFPFYQNKLVGYYPFSKEAMNEVSLQSFNQFFASSGLFDRFFTNYLLPFIDQSSQTWQWRERDGLSLTFSEAALGQIQRAYQIHHAFFPGNSSSANVKFKLKPASFSVGVKRFGVDMDEQYLSYVPHDRVAKTLYWPGNAPVHGVTLMVEDDAGHVAKQTEVGLWAWFKLFNSADQYEASTEQVKATFRLGSYLASCEFDSDQNNNPLNPLLLQQLDLPENL